MKKRCLIPLLAMILSVSLGAVERFDAHAQNSAVDCTGFASFEEANAYYAANPDAQAALDDDGDGTACEVFFRLERRNDRAEAGARRGASTEVQLAQEATENEDLDCEDFDTQEDAQTVLDTDPADPNNLDPNGDGIACALLPSAADLQTADGGEAAAGETADAGDTASEQTADEGNQTREERRQARQQDRSQNQDQENAEETPAVTCDDYTTAEDAQSAFDADPEGLAALDPDGNGIACEELLAAEPAPEQTQEDRRANRRNRDADNQEEPPAEVVIDEPVPVQVPVQVQEDIDCAEFDFQEEAQAVYNQDPSDPYNLDPSGDGFACSSLPFSTPVVTQVPRTGVGMPTDGMSNLLAMVGALMSAAAGAAVWATRLTRSRRVGRQAESLI
jgi:hypothetical protein